MKWTQKHLGSLLNVNDTTISKFETGKATLTDAIIIKASKLFNVTSDYLLGLSFTRTSTELVLNADEKKILFYFNRLNEDYKDSAKGHLVDLYREQLHMFSKDFKKRAV
jgi:transcriptional regulator with XRE-family HTH domain